MQVCDRWALLVSNWFGASIEKDELFSMRNQAVEHLAKERNSLKWQEIYGCLYDMLPEETKKSVDKTLFMETCHHLEVNAEIGVQYPNRNLLIRLEKAKQQGSRIIIVANSHFDKSDLMLFMKAKRIDVSIFDRISYRYEIDTLSIDPKEILTIGDQRSLGQKLMCQLRYRWNYNYAKRAFVNIEKTCRTYNSPLSEYALLFYLFSKNLLERLSLKQAKWVSFLAREGHYLKRSFDELNKYTSFRSNITSNYMLCSRRSCQSAFPDLLKGLEETDISIQDYLMTYGYDAEEIANIAQRFDIDEYALNEKGVLENNRTFMQLGSVGAFADMLREKKEHSKIAFKKYLESFLADDVVNIVDIGGRGGMQEAIERSLNQPTEGYYVGEMHCIYDINNRHGLLFTFCPNLELISPYANIYMANIQLYEQLTAASHGSAVGYELQNDRMVKVRTDWAENEKSLYEWGIGKLQEEMLLVERGASAWCGDMEYNRSIRKCAKLVLRTALFANKERLAYFKRLDEGFVWNFNTQTKGLTWNRKQAHVKFDILYAPERYTRYFAKLQRSLKMPIFKALYIPFSWLLFAYIWGSARTKVILGGKA